MFPRLSRLRILQFLLFHCCVALSWIKHNLWIHSSAGEIWVVSSFRFFAIVTVLLVQGQCSGAHGPAPSKIYTLEWICGSQVFISFTLFHNMKEALAILTPVSIKFPLFHIIVNNWYCHCLEFKKKFWHSYMNDIMAKYRSLRSLPFFHSQ